MSVQKKLLVGIAVLALFGTVTNYLYFSPLLTLLIPLCVFVITKDQLPRPIFWLYIFACLFIGSTLLYDWHSLLTFGYYRRDGNFVISYAPILVLPLFSVKFKLKKYIRYYYVFVVILYSALFLFHYLMVHYRSGLHNLTFGGLFYAQNAVGGFLAVVASLGLAYYYNRRDKKELCYFFALLLILFATYSRGSILGFIGGVVAWYLSITKRFKLLIATITVPVLLTIGCLFIGYPYFKTVINTHNQVGKEIGTDVSSKNANIFLRVFYTFPRAYYIFLHSPVFGTGVGSYDDRPLELKKIMPLVSYNAQPHKVHTNAHAHHSYLHILAEQGIVGLTVFLIFWISLFGYLLRIRGQPVMRDFLLIAYFTLTFASFTEHRITTPSNMLPFTISLGLFMANREKHTIYKLEKISE